MPPPISSGTWAIDPAHSQIGFSVRHLGITNVHGMFTEHTGEVHVGEELASSSVTVSAKTASITTGHEFRDGNLKNAAILDTDQYPDMTFMSTAIAEGGPGYVLTGDLTIKGVTQPVDFDVSFNGTDVFPLDSSTRAGFTATSTIRRSDFDAGFGVPLASDTVVLRLDVELVAPKS